MSPLDALFTDQYQLTMAQLYFRMGLHERPAQFEHFTRSNPDYGAHQAGYSVVAGLQTLLDAMPELRFTEADLDVLASQTTRGGGPLFDPDFLAWLASDGQFGRLSLRAIPEGRVVHPNVPLTLVQGPLAMAQLFETVMLNQLNFQTLIATKASRVAEAARGRPVLEFGLRRAPGDGGDAATRAALIGGAVGSSNVGQSHRLGVQPSGTHAHSMVQAFVALGEGELAAFQAYADIYPDDCVLLVDTIDTLGSGVPNAIRVFETLRRRGHSPVGIRLDSGDLAYLAIQSALLLDRAGFADTTIVLSSGLDEILISQILTQIDNEAHRYGIDRSSLIARLTFGVGSKLSASAGQPYLDGVYKLTAITDEGRWKPAIKLSDSAAKTQTPGEKDVLRLYDARGQATADVLTVAGHDLEGDPVVLHHPIEAETRRSVPRTAISRTEPLLIDVYADGTNLTDRPALHELQERRKRDLERLDPGVKRLVNPHTYHVSLTDELWRLKKQTVDELRLLIGPTP